MGNIFSVKKEEKKNDGLQSTPDPGAAMIFFFIVTSVYCVISIFLNNSQQRLIVKVCYVLFIIVGQFFINLSLTESMCGVRQWKSTLFTTIVPWLIIFIVLHLFLAIFPGWLVPFSNTFGFAVAKMMGLPDLMKEILVEPGNENINAALESVRSDASLFINELYTEADEPMYLQENGKNKLDVNKQPIPIKDDKGMKLFERKNFNKTWDNLTKNQFIKPFKGDEEQSFKDRLYAFVQMKFAVAEYVWNLLTGFFVTSVTYNYIINTGCAKSAKIMKQRHDAYQANASKNAKKEEEKKENDIVYKQT